MKPIVIFGVCHTAAMLNDTLKALDKFPITKNTLVFVEPKKKIIQGIEKCSNPHIMKFFKKIIRYVLDRGASIVPLNPAYTPSHFNPILYRKIAQQFAEEEYMADVVASAETGKQKVVVIGDVHAPRMRNLLKAKGLTVKYKQVSGKAPSDIFVESWREALLGHMKKLISVGWLLKFRRDLRKKLMLPDDLQIPAVFYGDEKMYRQYINEARMMVKHGEEETQGYLVNVDDAIVNDSNEVKGSTLNAVRKLQSKDDHEEMHDENLR